VGLFTLKRVPEPEIMDTDEEVDAYSSAAAQAYLEAIDRTFVDHLDRLIGPSGLLFGDVRVLDFGCGPGQIPIMLARRWPKMRIVGADAGANMIAQAKRDAATAGVDIACLTQTPSSASCCATRRCTTWTTRWARSMSWHALQSPRRLC
jgi:SAM-dependent methyltransferase